MKFVMSKDETAAALALTPAEFDEKRPILESLGFPQPIEGLTERWSIMDVINWVNRPGRQSSRVDSHAASTPADVRH